VISVDEIVEHMSVYERSTNTDRAGFHKRIQASIEEDQDAQHLAKDPVQRRPL